MVEGHDRQRPLLVGPGVLIVPQAFVPTGDSSPAPPPADERRITMAEHTTYHETRPARRTSAPTRVAWCLAAALTVMAGAASVPPIAGADTARTVALHRGVTAVNLTVPHVSWCASAGHSAVADACERSVLGRAVQLHRPRAPRAVPHVDPLSAGAARGAGEACLSRAVTAEVSVEKWRRDGARRHRQAARHRAADGRAEDTTRRSRLPRHAIARVHRRAVV